MCMGGAPTPAPPPPPPAPPAPPPPPPTPVSPETKQAATNTRQQALSRAGYASTIMTSKQGVLSSADTTKKTLLGV